MNDTAATSVQPLRLRYSDSEQPLDWRMTSAEFVSFQRASGATVIKMVESALRSLDVGDTCVTHADWMAFERLILNLWRHTPRVARTAPAPLIKAEAARRAAHKKAFTEEMRAADAEQRALVTGDERPAKAKTKATKKGARS